MWSLVPAVFLSIIVAVQAAPTNNAVKDGVFSKLIQINKNIPTSTYQVDIVMTKALQRSLLLMYEGKDIQRDTVIGRLWPGKKVPYTIRADVTVEARQAITAAKSTLNGLNCVEWVPRTTEANYVEFIVDQGCYSYPGYMAMGKQPISIGPGCEHRTIVIHEMMHALGFYHEQSRQDRDNFVTIHWGNIHTAAQSQFVTQVSDTRGMPYDKKSIMHYDKFAFSQNGLQTISSKAYPAEDLGQPLTGGITQVDKAQILKLYSCPTPPPVNGQWAGWGPWDTCTKTCGSGSQVRRRECIDPPPLFGGSACPGSNQESRSCNTQACPGGGGGGGGCFPETGLVQTPSGTLKSVKDVRVGDKVLTADSDGNPTFSRVVMMIHKIDGDLRDDYVTIKTNSDVQVTLTRKHLLFTAKNGDSVMMAKYADKVVVGDMVKVFDSQINKFTLARVASIENTTATGAYAPLTEHGTVVVDSVYSSCYAEINSHSVAHAFMTPYIWWNQWTAGKSETSVPSDEYHWYVKFLKSGLDPVRMAVFYS